MGPARSKVAVCAAGVFALSLLTACGSDGKAATDTTIAAADTTVAAVETTVPTTGAPPATAAPPVTFTGDALAVEQAFRARIDAYNASDGKAFVSTYSARRVQEYGEKTAEVEAGVTAGNIQLRLFAIRGIEVSGDTATVTYENAFGPRLAPLGVTTVLASTETWVREGGAWKFDQVQTGPPELPAGGSTVDVDVADGQRLAVPATMSSGPVALRFTNSGSVQHRAYLLQLADGVDLPAYIEKLADPATTTPAPEGSKIGSTDPIEPGATGVMVFSGPLPAGRYLLLCGFRNEAGVSHTLAEHAEFTVA